MKRSEISRRSGVGRSPESQPASNAAVRAFVHDVVNPVAAIQASVGALRARAVLTDDDLADVRRIEEAAGTILELVTNLGPRPEAPRGTPGRPAAMVTPSVDLYVLCCELAQLRRYANGTVIHCRAFGDPRGDWNREQLSKLLDALLGHAIAHVGTRAPMTISVTGMARYVRVDIHGLGWLSAEKLGTSLDVSSKVGRPPPGALINAIASRNGGVVLRLRLPRWNPVPVPTGPEITRRSKTP